MMRFSPIWAVVSIILAYGNAHAQYRDADGLVLRPPVIDVNNEFGIAAQGFMQSYSEAMPNGKSGTFDSEQGTIPGLQVKATMMQDAYGISNLYAGIQYQYEQGGVGYNSDYTMSGLPRSSPLNSTTHYNLNDVEFELGKGFLISYSALVTPFIEGGYRDWRRELNASQTEDYTNFYAGAGVRGDLGITNRLVLSGKLGIAATISPSMTATNTQGLTYSLGSEPLYQAGVGIDYAVYSMLHLYGGVDYTHLSYGGSPWMSYGATAYREPSSTTDDLAFRLGIAVRYW